MAATGLEEVSAFESPQPSSTVSQWVCSHESWSEEKDTVGAPQAGLCMSVQRTAQLNPAGHRKTCTLNLSGHALHSPRARSPPHVLLCQLGDSDFAPPRRPHECSGLEGLEHLRAAEESHIPRGDVRTFLTRVSFAGGGQEGQRIHQPKTTKKGTHW